MIKWSKYSPNNCAHKCRGKDTVFQPRRQQWASERETVTLDCEYNTTNLDPTLLWYQQKDHHSPKYILLTNSYGAGDTAAEFRERFHSSLNSSTRRAPLMIQKLSVSDSAVYYCLQWYRQYPGSRPEFLLFLTEFGGGSDPALRLTAEANRQMKRVDLNISHTVVSDSALYYCALVPTVTGNSTTPYKNTLHSHTEHSKDLFLTGWSSYVLITVESKGFYSKTEDAL
uniref:Ig-like domain-containing protein n=1 Tax=Pygocentrus nattereri TaxID=42514 RepID=A0A3B4EHL6_PYGNA